MVASVHTTYTKLLHHCHEHAHSSRCIVRCIDAPMSVGITVPARYVLIYELKKEKVMLMTHNSCIFRLFANNRSVVKSDGGQHDSRLLLALDTRSSTSDPESETIVSNLGYALRHAVIDMSCTKHIPPVAHIATTKKVMYTFCCPSNALRSDSHVPVMKSPSQSFWHVHAWIPLAESLQINSKPR